MSPPIRPKGPALAPMRPRVQSSADHSVPEARRAREPLPDEATVPMRRSDRPASMPAEDGWNSDDDATTTGPAPGTTGSIPRDAASPRPANVTTDANALRAALLEAMEPLQAALDDLTLKIARERVDRKEAIDKLERAVARVATANPPPVTPFAAAQMLAPIQSPFSQAPAPPPQAAPAAPAAVQKNTMIGMAPQARAPVAAATETPLPTAAQPYSVSPSANPPPVAAGPAPAIPAAAPVPNVATEKPASPAPPRVAEAAAPARAPIVVAPSSPPIKIDFDYSTDLSFELPPGLDGSRRKRILAWTVAFIVVGGAIAMIVSMIISRSRPPGAL